MFRTISGGILVAAVIFTGGLAVGSLSTPCPTEDSTWCTWYADVQGNGTGYSFTAVTESFAVKH